jgi:outer membrane protein assembly factor BamB
MKKHLTLFVLAMLALIQVKLPLLAAGQGANLGNELLKLTASDASENQAFASSVAVSGNTAIIGSHDDHDLGDYAGSAYLFDATTGQQRFKLFASDAERGDSFGFSVAISGGKVIVGANGKDFGSGSAYLFDVVTGQELFKIIPSERYGIFGYSVGISGNTAIIGAPVESIASSAYLFDVLTGQELFKLTPSDAFVHYGNRFGITVAISGNTAIVGAPFDDEAGSHSGAAYLFDVTTGQQRLKLMASSASAYEGFGSSVAISGNTAIVGAVGGDYGSAYLFDVTTGQELTKLTPADLPANSAFGRSVAISGNVALVGANRDAHAGYGAGSAYLFDVATHEQLFKLIASDAGDLQYFGESVSISDDYALVGSAGAAPFGAAYLFSTVPEPTSLTLLALALPLLVGGNWRRPSTGGISRRCRFRITAAIGAVALARY